MKRGRVIVSAAVWVTVLFLMRTPLQSKEVPRVGKEEAVKMLGDPDVIIIDVRQGSDWKASGEKIRGAVREEPDEIGSWMGKYPEDKTLIFY